MSSESTGQRPLGHAERIEALWASAAAGRLPHALLFSGPSGCGKYAAMEWLARGLLCAEGPGPPCGTCGPCKRVEAGSHPDILRLDPAAEGQNQLTIFFIAERRDRPDTAYKGMSCEAFLDLRAGEGGWRIVLLRETERMNLEAQNAFLKTLEEPSSNVLIAMECGRPHALLDTVRSRLVEVSLDPLVSTEVHEILVERGVPEEEAPVLARLAEGSPGRALDLLAYGALEALPLITAALRGTQPPALGRQDLLAIEGEYPGRTAAARKRRQVAEWLDLILFVLRDEERRQAGVPVEQLAFGDLLVDLPSVDEPTRRLRLDQVIQARQDVDLNLSPDTLVERALTALAPPLVSGRRTR